MTLAVPQTVGTGIVVTFRQRQARTNNIDSEVEFAEFARQRFAPGNNTAFAGAINDLLVFAHATRVGADSDNLAVRALDHCRGDSADAIDGPPEIDRDLAFKIFDRLVQEQPVGRPSGIVDENVDLAEVIDGARRHGFNLCRARHVCLDEQRVTRPRLAQLPGDLFGLCGVDISDNNVGTFGNQTLGDRLANIRCATGDNGRLCIQTQIHYLLFPRSWNAFRRLDISSPASSVLRLK